VGPLFCYFLLSLFTKTNAGLSETCSPSKTYQGVGYVFMKEDRVKAGQHGCNDGCIYRLEEDEDVKPGEICFREWELKAMSLEKPVKLGGCLGPDDKLPKHWIPLLQSPCNFLKGPKCIENKIPAENIGIVGAGIAGLTLAWILQKIGHNVTIIEATDRVGGRAFTHYGDGWYGDLGAMRFPPKHEQPLLYQLFEQFNIPLETFTNSNEGPGSYFYINGKYFSSTGK